MEHRVSQSMICCSAVGVGNNDGPLGLRTRDLFDDWEDCRNAGTRAGQQERCFGRCQYEVPRWGTDIEHISDLHVIMQIAGNPAVGRAVHAPYAQDGDLQASAYGGGRDGVLPGLPITIGRRTPRRIVQAR
jgi:hypothetical protein